MNVTKEYGILDVFVANPTDDTHVFHLAALEYSNGKELITPWETSTHMYGNDQHEILPHETAKISAWRMGAPNTTEVGKVKISILDEIDGFVFTGTFDILNP